MEVNLHPNIPGVNASLVSSTQRRAAPAPNDSVTFNQSESLNASLATTLASRPEAVQRARELIADVSYPPQVMIHRIGTLLAMQQGPESD